MNHFMLPKSNASGHDTWKDINATRYGGYAMESLINVILGHGGERKRLEVKLFGGARILATMTDIGEQNINFVREYLHDEGLSVVGEDLGLSFPRKVYYFPKTGKVRLKKLHSLHNNTVEKREREYEESIIQKPTSGDIELF
jgi:chemotaxis protein CheD